MHGVQVDELHAHLVRAHVVDQRGDPRRDAGAPALGVEVAHRDVPRHAHVARRQTAQHELHQAPHFGRIDPVRVLGEQHVGRPCVLLPLLHLLAHLLQVGRQLLHRVVVVLAVKEPHPGVCGHQRVVALAVLRPEVDRQRAGVERLRLEVVPAVLVVHARIEGDAVLHLAVLVDRLHHGAPDVHVLAVAGHQQGVPERVRRAVLEVGAVVGDRLAVLVQTVEAAGVAPAVHAAPPVAAGQAAADLSVQPDVAGDQAVVRVGALDPGVRVLLNPFLVLGIAGGRVGVERHGGGGQVQGYVALDVAVGLEVEQVVVEVAVAAPRLEAPLDLERIAGPVDRLRRAQHRAAAAVQDAADDPVLRVVVGLGRLVGVARQVEAGEAADALPPDHVPGLAQPFLEQAVVALAVVHPVEAGGELLVVHAVGAQLGDRGLGFGVLPDVAVHAAAEQLQHLLGAAEGVEIGPVGHVLRGIVGAVQGAPAHKALEVAALVEVAVVKRRDRRLDGAHQLALQQRPVGWRGGGGDGHGGGGRGSCGHGMLLASGVRSPAMVAE